MPVSVKINVFVTAAALLVATGAARAEVDPDRTSYRTDLYPTPRSTVCLNGNCYSPPIYGATQSHDCNKAGFAGETDGGFSYAGSSLRGIDYRLRNVVNPSFGPDSSTDFHLPGRYTGSQQFDGPTERPTIVQPLQGMLYPLRGFGMDEWPNNNPSHTETGADKDPVKITIGEAGTFGSTGLGVGYSDDAGEAYSKPNMHPGLLDAADNLINDWLKNAPILGSNSLFDSINIETPLDGLPAELQRYQPNQFTLAGTTYVTVTVDEQHIGDVILALEKAGITDYEYNVCRKVLTPTDPNYLRTGRHGGNSWGEKEDDQWAIKRSGFTADENSAWNLVPESAAPVVVAVIDTGLDWHHLDIDANNIWRNSAEDPDNGVDDDNNGYVDDVIGWDFFAESNRPWDFDGHGTVVAGIIAAAHNDAGIAGINPYVKIMVLKAVNNFGTTRASYLAEAIVYAVDNGAQVINISVGGAHATRIEQAALNYAYQAGVLVVAASGNDGIELDDFGPGGNDYVLTVGATHVDNRAAAFSNYGDKVDLVAPGVDVLSLRARYTDANYRPGPEDDGEYEVGDNYVGDDKRYLHVSGTSFSTPIVAGIASLVLSKSPELTAVEVERILKQTATDIEFPGNDQYSGHGMINAKAALSVENDYSVTAEISRVDLVPAEAPQFARVYGTIDASKFKRAWMQIGPGENPGSWRFVGPKRKYPIRDSELGIIPIRNFNSEGIWQVVVNVEHQNGVIKRAAFPVTIK